ncbi:hypothetical protein [Inhella sp.]|uniref:hypothetical protein n=1 Tax=Inhella sp. TaxID=1921806 RepID=UPI0035B3FFDD
MPSSTMTRLLCPLAACLLLSACAATLINPQHLQDRTSRALGLESSEFTISQRSDEGGTTRYQVRTRSGQEYHCSVGVAPSILGRTVTDALCTRKGEAPRNPLLR